MLKVRIGWMKEIHGRVKVTPDDVVYSGEDPGQVGGITGHKREWYDRREGVLPVLTDAELVRSLSYRRQGPVWGST